MSLSSFFSPLYCEEKRAQESDGGPEVEVAGWEVGVHSNCRGTGRWGSEKGPYNSKNLNLRLYILFIGIKNLRLARPSDEQNPQTSINALTSLHTVLPNSFQHP
jgi:hypothetical protein